MPLQHINSAGLARWATVGGVDDCWPFRLKTFVFSKGKRLRYGRITYKGKLWRAHRLVAFLSGILVRDDDLVCHRCDNPICLNPKHLFVGTANDNMRDKMAKGRHRFVIVNRKLTMEQAEVIRRRALSGENQVMLAKEFGLSQSNISMIKNGRVYAAN